MNTLAFTLEMNLLKKCSLSTFYSFRRNNLRIILYTNTHTRGPSLDLAYSLSSRSLSKRTRTWLMRCEESAFVLS